VVQRASWCPEKLKSTGRIACATQIFSSGDLRVSILAGLNLTACQAFCDIAAVLVAQAILPVLFGSDRS
jgi:hypothetical protein